MATRTVTGTVLRADSSPWSGAPVHFVMAGDTFLLDPDATYPEDGVSTTTDADGEFSVTLTSGLSVFWRCVLPGSEGFQFAVPDGEATTIESLRAEYTGVPQAITVSSGLLRVFNVTDPAYRALGDGASDDTTAIDAAMAAALAAGGGVVYFPDGTYRTSTAPSTDATEHNLHFLGESRAGTIIKPLDGATTGGFNLTGNFCSIRNLTVDGNRANLGAGGHHGIRIQGIGHVVENVHVKDAAGYGIGVGQGSGSTVQELTIRDVVIERTGADGIDFKNQSSTNRHITLSNVTVMDFDVLATGDKSGIDCRGPVKCSDIAITQVTSTSISVGFRFRPDSLGSTLTNFVIVGNTATGASKGVQLGDVGNTVCNGRVENFGTGVHAGATANDCLVSNVVVVNADEAGGGAFLLGNTAQPVSLVNCHASGSVNAYKIEGSDHRLVNCSARDCTRGFFITGDNTVIRGGALIGGFVHSLRIDAGGDNSVVEGLDFRQVTGGSFADNGAGTVLRDCPGRSTIGDIVLNDDGGDYDLRVEGDTASQLFVVDAGTDAVRVGTTSAGVIAHFASGGIVLNEDGADRDVRIEGDTATQLFVCDAGLDAVRIGTTSAGTLGHFRTVGIVFNDGATDTDIRVEGTTATSLFVTDAGLNAVQVGGTTPGTIADFRAAAVVFNEAAADQDFRVEGDTDANLLTVDAGLDMVGIGAVPATKFDVNADSIRVRTAKTPASATAPGIQGQIAWDATHLYVCIATNVWQRVAHATW